MFQAQLALLLVAATIWDRGAANAMFDDVPVGRCRLGGPQGPSVSCIALGTLHFAETGNASAVLSVIQNAVSLGITTFDLSDVYAQMPQLFGAALSLQPGLREKIEVIAKMDIVSSLTAFGFDSGSSYDTSTEHLNAVLDKYLTALNTTYIDVVLLHRQDYLLDFAEMAACFAAWKQAGTVRYFGASNFGRDAFSALAKVVPLVANELEVSPLNPKALYDGTVAFHYGDGSTVLAWGPLGGDPWGGANRLFRVLSLDGTQRPARIRAGLATVAAQLGDSADVIAVAWLLRHPAKIIPILGTVNAVRLANQTRAVVLARAMTRQQWYYIADAAGVPIY